MSEKPSPLFTFLGGNEGPWKVLRAEAVLGKKLPDFAFLNILPGPRESHVSKLATWRHSGAVSHERYVLRRKHEELVKKQEGLGRPQATLAAMILISKTPQWWAFSQDERRKIFEESSEHIAIGMRYLPAVARRLYHSRDLGEAFDFITWFEFAPEHSGKFDELVGLLRQTEEWRYIEHEVDLRLIRA